MSLLLSLDTSHNSVSVALFEQEACLRFETLETSFQNTVSAHLAPMIQDIFNQERRDLEDVAALVINRGPGSFTGLRSGMAFMQGLALAGSIPLYGVTGFQALSGQKPQEWDADETVYLLDTKLCRVFKRRRMAASSGSIFSVRGIFRTFLLCYFGFGRAL